MCRVTEWHVVRDVVAPVFWLGFTRFQVRRARAVWRGEPASWLPMTFRGPEINRRNHAVFVVAITSFCAAAMLLLIGEDTGLRGLSYVGVALSPLLFVCLPIMTVITVFNRPRALVPPSLRDQPGSFRAGMKRRAARRAGLPETDHTVELHDVRPLAEDPKPFPPYFIAICSNDECGWLSDPVDEDVPDAEQRVRRLAHEHSATVVGPVRAVG